MMRRSLAASALPMLLLLGVLDLTACNSAVAAADSGTDDAALPRDANGTQGDMVYVTPKCWDPDRNPIVCRSDRVCGPFSTCQSGVCCSGVLDPVSCQCLCNGSPEPCKFELALCCPGDPQAAGHPLPDLGVLMCRPKEDCY